jgi:microcystin-dependent protein
MTMKNISTKNCIAIFIALAATSQVYACSSEGYLGSMCITAATYCPPQTVPANGATLPINGNQALYSVIGNIYGGDGTTNFKLPDMRGRSVVGVGNTPGGSVLTYGEQRGAESVKLIAANIPPLAVTLQVGTEDGSMAPGPNTYLAGKAVNGATTANMYVTPSSSTALQSISGLSVGSASASPIKTVSPQLAMTYCVVIQGMYPPRP